MTICASNCPIRYVTLTLVWATWVLGPSRARADETKGQWLRASTDVDAASAAAEALATALARRLKSERSKTVFLDVSKCQPAIPDAPTWCLSFQSKLEVHLLRQGLRFLSDQSKDEIRHKIAAEQVYQQNSMNVDLKKAVELGKQSAFQAFATVNVVGDGQGKINIAVKSINIGEGVVTVGEDVNLEVRTFREMSPQRAITAFGIIGGGLTGALLSYQQVQKARASADSAYEDYEKAGDTNGAVRARNRVEAADKAAARWETGILACGFVMAYGAFYYANAFEPAKEYRIMLTDRSQPGSTDKAGYHFQPDFAPQGVSLALTWKW